MHTSLQRSARHHGTIFTNPIKAKHCTNPAGRLRCHFDVHRQSRIGQKGLHDVGKFGSPVLFESISLTSCALSTSLPTPRTEPQNKLSTKGRATWNLFALYIVCCLASLCSKDRPHAGHSSRCTEGDSRAVAAHHHCQAEGTNGVGGCRSLEGKGHRQTDSINNNTSKGQFVRSVVQAG